MDHRTIDDIGRQAIDLTSGGNAYVFQNGYLREVKWANVNGIPMAVEQSGACKACTGKVVGSFRTIFTVVTSNGENAALKGGKLHANRKIRGIKQINYLKQC